MTDVLLAEERERRRLADDLYDGLAQTIALTRMKLAALRSRVSDEMERELDEIDALIVQSDRAARMVARELSPPILHDIGLEPALRWLCENLQTRYDLQVSLTILDAPDPLDAELRIVLFRSIREPLITAAIHSGSKRAGVLAGRNGDCLRFRVSDHGVGLAGSALGLRGTGLRATGERLIHFGGLMEFDVRAGAGMHVQIQVPGVTDVRSNPDARA